MKVVGIITEYNPFHNGHKYHIEKSKELTGADYVVAVMSGNYVQRGAPAITDKYARTMMALNNGVDLVFELPVCYATGSAQYFALGAVTLLSRLGIVDYLCFGSECGNIDELTYVSDLFSNSPEGFQNLLYSYIKEGYSYPAARTKAAQQTLSQNGQNRNSNIQKIISEPNNILGIEYIGALRQINSSIKPLTIKRHMAGYHDVNLNNGSSGMADCDNEPSVSSATAIRTFLETSENATDLSEIKNSVPEGVFDFLSANYNATLPVTTEDFSNIIKYKLMSESEDELAAYLDLSPDLAARIKNMNIVNSILNTTIKDLSLAVKTKNITLTRLNRALIHALLNIKTETFREFVGKDIIYYARILGMKKETSHLIRQIKSHGDIPVITKVSNAFRQLDAIGLKMLEQDIFAAHLYNQIVYEKFKTAIPNEYKHGICIL